MLPLGLALAETLVALQHGNCKDSKYSMKQLLTIKLPVLHMQTRRAGGVHFKLWGINNDSFMQFNLVFRPLSAPLSDKILLAFRQDAGWSKRDTSGLATAAQPGGLVQWVTVESGKKRVGIARLELAPPQFCYLSDFIVLQGHRGRGVGDWFMKQIEQHCLGLGIPRVLLRPLDDSRGFYEKLNFVADPLVAGFLKKEILPMRRKMLPF
jgi:GNAT superfamily N-acetyltransferase